MQDIAAERVCSIARTTILMRTYPTSDNTSPIEKALYTTQRKNNMNAFKREETEPFSNSKALEQTVKVILKRLSEVVKVTVKTALYANNAVAK